MTSRRTLGALTTAALVVLSLAGCSLPSQGIYDAPLPGGVAIGRDGYEVTATFADALDLVPQSSVKVDNVAVGRVTKIALRPDGRAALVTMLLRGDVALPVNTVARLTQTSLLGEKYVALSRPAAGATGSLRTTRVIGLEGTSEAIDAERVLGAMSLLLNGGGIAQFQEISRELTAVSSGRDAEIRAFLENIAQFAKTLNTRKESITDALDSLDRLGRTLNDNTTQLTTALEKLPPGLQVLADQRHQLIAMLSSLDSLSKVTVSTLSQSKDNMVADLERLDPILTQLAAAGKTLPASLQILFTFPFPDSVLGAIKGDYVNAFLVTNFATPGTTISNDISAAGWPNAYPGSCGSPADGFYGAPCAPPGASALSRSGSGPAQIGPPPMILPPTTSAAPGVPSPTITTTATRKAASTTPATPTPTTVTTSTPTTPATPTPTVTRRR